MSKKEGYYKKDGYPLYDTEPLNGEAIYVYDNGHVYEGEFLNNEFHGSGNLVMGQYTYIGNFRKGKLHGKGVLTHTNGYKVTGIWQNDRFKEYTN